MSVRFGNKSIAHTADHPPMTETELKLQVPAGRLDALAAAVGTASARTERLQAVYLDTPGRALAAAGIALRLRREGRHWVQTLKALGEDPLQRLEHNVPRGSGTAAPAVDVALHAGTPAGVRLEAVLRALPADALQPVFGTDIRRTRRVLRVAGGALELALDRGRLHAGARECDVCELEIELLRGPAMLVIAQARRWVARHGLWLDVQSKAERGERLAAGDPPAPATGARAPNYPPRADLAAGRRAVLAACAEQVLDNASRIAGGVHGDEHVHQLRVGLRRLRSALRLFDGTPADGAPAPLAAGAAELFGRLGAARDQAAIGGPLRAELQAAMAALGLSAQAPALPAAGVAETPVAVLRSASAQAWLLDLLAALQPGAPAGPAEPGTPAESDDDLRAHLAAGLQRWHRQVAAEAPRFAELDDEARHRLRKRVKRLRYAVEFAAPLHEAKAVRRYLQPLRELQDRLGAFNDACVGLAGYRMADAADPAVGFALGWLAARREQRLAECAPALQALAGARRFWKKRRRPR